MLDAGYAMAHEDAIGGHDSQVRDGEQLQVGSINLGCLRPVGFAEARQENLVLVNVTFANPLILPLSQLMIAYEIMDAPDTGT